MPTDTDLTLKRLLRGISTSHVETVRDAWRALLGAGGDATSAVLKTLKTSAWSENPRGPLAQYLGILLSLLDELDREAFEQEIGRLKSGNLHPRHRRTVEILSQRCADFPASQLADGTPVYISPEIADPATIAKCLANWSRTRHLALDKVTRIDVIARHPQLDYLGKYSLFFSGIILTWPAERTRGLRRWWQTFRGEFTFYHEVGHHVCEHLEGGSVEEQEAEANAYAREMMRNSHPVFMRVLRIMYYPFRFLRRKKPDQT